MQEEEIVVVFEIPDKAWSTNQDRTMHYRTRHKLVAAWKEATKEAWESQPRPHTPLLGHHVISLRIPFTTVRRRDPHNYCGTVLKAIVDGLVEGGVFPDDTPEHVGHREPVLTKGTTVEIVITKTV